MAHQKFKTSNAPKVNGWSVNTDEVAMLAMVIGGIVTVALLCLFTPVKEFTVKAVSSLLRTDGTGKTVSASLQQPRAPWKGIYSMGQVFLSLGAKDEYLDSEVDLEYNGQVLHLSTHGQVEDPNSARQYFNTIESKIRDAFVMQSSNLSGGQVTRKDGISRFKAQMINALNEALGEDKVIANVLFKKFLLYTEEDEA